MQNVSVTSAMSPPEKQAISVLSSVMAVRMLGLFLILPVLSVFARDLIGSTPLLVGLSVGIYGLAQAGLQLIFGILSDRLGRKPLVLIGLATLVMGSLLAAVSQSIYMLIFARALQGAGAIGSTILAWVADVTAPQQRTKAMAILGGVIGSSFALSLVLGSLVNSFTGPRGVFTVTALLATVGILLVAFRLPNVKISFAGTQQARPSLIHFIRDPILSRLYLCAFVLHGILAAVFVVLPVLLTQSIQLSPNYQWFFYFGVILTAFAIVLPQIRGADAGQKHGWLMLMAITGMTIGIAILAFFVVPTLWILSASMVLFFSGFALLEALLPALVSRLAAPEWKGTTLSIYSTLQFLGIFVGGGLGGLLFLSPSDNRLFLLLTVVGCLWFGFLFPLRKKLSSQPH